MARHRLSDAQSLQQIPAARARAARERRTDLRAAQARYVRSSRTLRIQLTNGAALLLPVALIPSLARATDGALAKVMVEPFGMLLHWEQLDVDLSVEGIAQLVFGPRVLLPAADSAGGRTRSDAKAKAARDNGKKGGRPRTVSAR